MIFRLKSGALALWLPMLFASTTSSGAVSDVDILAYFEKARAEHRVGMARKSKPVDARSAVRGEVIVTTIKGEGKETASSPAKAGDMVVRNRSKKTGNEEFLVAADTFAKRYEGPLAKAGRGGWAPYRPVGIPVRYALVRPEDGEFRFLAPWGEPMVAKPGDVIVQDPDNPKDTYRVQKDAFASTYELLEKAPR